jgi:hypothetical protein
MILQRMAHHLEDANTMVLAKTRKNCFYKLFCGGNYKSHLEYYNNGTELIAKSFKNSNWVDCQIGNHMHKFSINVKEKGSKLPPVCLSLPW